MQQHEDIWKRLDCFVETNRIPNIIFYGEHGSGKKSIVRQFIDKIYKCDKQIIKTQVMFVNCAFGKGIKFVREELKYFAKTNMQRGVSFKSIVFLNTDNLTMDAQSALRRCIELYSHNTRFFIVVEKLNTLMKPILSRFCEIHVPKELSEEIAPPPTNLDLTNVKHSNVVEVTEKLYLSGVSALDILDTYKQDREEVVFAFSKWRHEFRSERLLILMLLNFLFLDNSFDLENISFMSL